VAGALVVAGCSDDDGADPATTTTSPPTSTSPSTTAPAEGNDTPMPVAWVRQVGGTGDDVLRAVAGRDDLVIGAGTTTGLPPTGDPGGRTSPAAGATAAFTDVVAAVDGSPTATVQSPQSPTATADGLGSGSGAGALTMACGATPAASREDDDGAGAGADAWCAPVGADGVLGAAQPVGSDMADSFLGVAVHSDGEAGRTSPTSEPATFAVGRAEGLFPGAKDPTGGYLGEGDALVTRLDASGALRWARQFGTTAADTAAAVTTSDDGDALVAGSTQGRTDGDVGGPIGRRDAWVARMDPSGNLRWLTQFGTTADDDALAVARGGDPRRGTEVFVAAGRTDGAVGSAANLGGEDATVAAFDASGRQLWSAQIGSSGDDEATGVVVDGATVYVTGTAAAEIVGGQRISLTPAPPAADGEGEDPSSPTTAPTTTAPTTTTAPPTTAPTTTAPPSGGGLDGFVAAIDVESGTIRWVAQFGTTGDEVVTGMTRTESGLVVVSGSTTGQMATTPPGGGTDGFMVAFTPPSGGGGAASMV
jgi:hypothetical protein